MTQADLPSTDRPAFIDIEWRGKDEKEEGVDASNGKVLVRVNPKFYRPAEVDLLIGDARKARERLGWRPRSTFAELVHEMIHADRELLTEGARRDGQNAL